MGVPPQAGFAGPVFAGSDADGPGSFDFDRGVPGPEPGFPGSAGSRPGFVGPCGSGPGSARPGLPVLAGLVVVLAELPLLVSLAVVLAGTVLAQVALAVLDLAPLTGGRSGNFLLFRPCKKPGELPWPWGGIWLMSPSRGPASGAGEACGGPSRRHKTFGANGGMPLGLTTASVGRRSLPWTGRCTSKPSAVRRWRWSLSGAGSSGNWRRPPWQQKPPSPVPRANTGRPEQPKPQPVGGSHQGNLTIRCTQCVAAGECPASLCAERRSHQGRVFKQPLAATKGGAVRPARV